MMLPSLHRLLRVVAVSSIALLTLTAAGPPEPEIGGGDEPFVIAIISDHYLDGDKAEFDADVDNFIHAGLLVDGFYSQHASKMQIVSVFKPTAAGQASSYDFTIATSSGNCAVTEGGLTAEKIQDVVQTVAPDHTIVIGNYPYNFGCTKGNWTYVAVDAVGTDVLQHELGHVVAGLYDEWALASNGTTPFPYPLPPTERRNCALWPTPPPYWTGMANVVNDAGCRLYSTGVVHPFHDCRMGASHHREFCEICRLTMTKAFNDIVSLTDYPDNQSPGITSPQDADLDFDKPRPPNPVPSHAATARTGLGFVNAAFVAQQPVPPVPTKPAGPTSILRVLVNFDPVKRVLQAKKGYAVTARYTPSYRKLGEYAYEILDGDRTLEVGVLPDRLFEARGYRGGGTQHQVSTPLPTDVIIEIPHLTVRELLDTKRLISVKFYWLSPTVQAQMITKAVFATIRGKLAQPVAQLNPDQLRAVF